MPELRLTDERLTFALTTDAYVDPALALSFMQRLTQEDRTIIALYLSRSAPGAYSLSVGRTSGRNWMVGFSPLPSLESTSITSIDQRGDWSIAQTQRALGFIEKILVPAILTLGIESMAYEGTLVAPAPPVRE